ncbi:response regulator transcription factor [Myroides sp. LJL115]
MSTKIAIVDDHKLFRKSFELLISPMPGIEVVFNASNGADLIQALESKSIEIDLVFLDIQMPGMNGYDTVAILNEHFPKIKILILTSYNDIYSISRMLEYKIDGYLTKNTDPEDIMKAICIVRDSGVYFDEDILLILAELDSCKEPLFVFLSEREVEVIKLFAQQYGYNEVADELSISPRTVEKHKESLMEKTQSKNFIGVILYAYSTHYLDRSDLIPRDKK